MRFRVAMCSAVVLATTAHAHTSLFYAGVDGQLGDQYQYQVKSNMGNAPVKDLGSDKLMCRSESMDAASVDKLAVTAGGTVTVQWQHVHNSVTIPVMSSSHVGPCMFYMAPLDTQGEGNVWQKIHDEGYENGKWCNNKVIDNDGKYDVPIPKGIPDGDYYLRTELLALHQAKEEGGAQFYPNCIVVTVSGGTTAQWPEGYGIPGIYESKHPGILFDRGGDDPKQYEIPGPSVFEGGGGESGNTTSPPAGDTSTGDTSKGDTSKGDTSKGDTSTGDTSKGDTSTGDTSTGDTSTEGASKSGGKACKGKKKRRRRKRAHLDL